MPEYQFFKNADIWNQNSMNDNVGNGMNSYL